MAWKVSGMRFCTSVAGKHKVVNVDFLLGQCMLSCRALHLEGPQSDSLKLPKWPRLVLDVGHGAACFSMFLHADPRPLVVCTAQTAVCSFSNPCLCKLKGCMGPTLGPGLAHCNVHRWLITRGNRGQTGEACIKMLKQLFRLNSVHCIGSDVYTASAHGYSRFRGFHRWTSI